MKFYSRKIFRGRENGAAAQPILFLPLRMEFFRGVLEAQNSLLTRVRSRKMEGEEFLPGSLKHICSF
jgi:hypothetical protein